jgi:uncharacterized membrane protein
MPISYNKVAGTSIERIAALSDGLFAIAMTLIVLEIRVPGAGAAHSEHDLAHLLVGLAPRLVTYMMSFLTLGIFWVGQQTQLNQLRRADRHLTWLYLGFLAFVALMPFSTELLAEFITYRIALLVYWGNILLLGVMLFFSWMYVCRSGLLKEGSPAGLYETMLRRIVAAQTLYAVGAVLCLVNTYWSIGFIVAVQLNYAIAPRIPIVSRLTS